MLSFLEIKPKSFGLDISDLSLKLVKLKKGKGGKFNLVSFGESSISPGIVEEGEVKDEKALAETIKKTISKVKGEKIKTNYVICSLPEEKSFLKVIQMPKIKKGDLKMAVRYEAENYIPFAREEVYLDSQVIVPLKDHLDHHDILIIGFPKSIVDPYISSLKKAGLQPLVLEHESSAVARALIKDDVSPYPVLLVDFGATSTSFIVFSGRALRFTSSVLVSSKDFTDAIAKELKIEEKEAEDMKIKYGIEGKEGRKLLKALIPCLTDFTEQIKKYLKFYNTHASHEHLLSDYDGIQRIFLCGGGANLKGLPEFLAERIGIKVELGDPLVNIIKSKKSLISKSDSLKYTTALGLSLRGVKENYD